MKYFLILFFISFSVFSQSDSSYYGEKISSSDLMQLSNIDFKNTSVKTKLEGEIISTCPKKGCWICLLYTSPSPRDAHESRMPSSA